MPALLGNPPGILTPGIGPNGPGPIDARKPITSVGVGTSSVPYAAFGSFASSNNGVWGFIGPAAASLQKPTAWYVRAGGSNNNGGSSTSLTADRTGTDGVANATTTFTSASAAFTSADIGKGICIATGTSAERYRIVAVGSATSITLNAATIANAGSQTWAIGGAWADLRAAVGDAAVTVASGKSGVGSGDTVYIGAGTFRAVNAVNATAPTTAGAFNPAFNGQVSIVGDVDGSHTGDAGMVQMTAYTTNDKTAPSATTLLNLNGKSNLAFSNIMFVGGAARILTATTATSQNITVRDCSFLVGTTAGQAYLAATNAFAVCFNWVVDRCNFTGAAGSNTVTVTLVTGVQADYNAGFTISNSQFIDSQGSPAIFVTNSGSLANNGGGVKIIACRFSPTGNTTITTTASRISTVFPVQVIGCFFGPSAGTILNAGTSGQIVESYNLIWASTARANVSVGAGSVSDGSYAPLFHFGQETQWGGILRRFGEPMAGSPLLGFGSQDPIATNPLDLSNRPRPAGLGAAGSQLAAVGALERGNSSVQATSPAPPSGTYVWKLVGPGYQEFTLPVDTSATTISCTVQRDTAYANASGVMPSLTVLANATIGVTGQTVYDTGAASANNTLSLAAFTATAVGAVTIRVTSADMSGASVVAFSAFQVV